MKQYAVIHCQKGKGSGGGQGYHIDRDTEHAHTFGQVDPTRRILNREFAPDKFTQLSMPEAIATRIKEGYTSNRAIRADTVRYVDTVMSESHEQMKELEKTAKLPNGPSRAKIGRGYVWERKHSSLHATHGRANPAYSLRFCSNYRRRTPFSQRDFIQENLSLAQDRYGEMMKPLALKEEKKEV